MTQPKIAKVISNSGAEKLNPKPSTGVVNLEQPQSGQQLIDAWLLQDRVERQPDGCIVWNGATSNTGCPIIRFQARSWVVNRLILSLEIGRDLSPDERAYRTCRNPLCVNPQHLQSVPFGAKTQKLAMRLTPNTLERVERYRNTDGPYWGRTPAMADAFRYVLSAALDWLEVSPSHKNLGAQIQYETGGKTCLLWISAVMAERIEQQRLPDERDSVLGKSLIEIGLQVLEKKLE